MMGYYRWSGALYACQSWFCSWIHSRPTWVLCSLCKSRTVLTICKGLLNHSCNKDDSFLRGTATGDGRIYHNAPESKCQSRSSELNHPQEKWCWHWDAQMLILEHYIESCTAVNSVHFSEMLWDQLKLAIWTNAENWYWKVLRCCLIMAVRTLPPTPSKVSTNGI